MLCDSQKQISQIAGELTMGMKMDKSDDQQNRENSGRAKLRREKPYVLEKILKYEEKHARGEYTPIIEFTYDFVCNMHCPHCSNLCFEERERSLTPEIIRSVADQADALGLAQMGISGGEPLFFPDLDKVIEAIGPNRFHLFISTNGTLLTEDKAKWLKSIGLDKVKISLDGVDENVKYLHSEGQTTSAIKALKNAKAADLQAVAQTVISHQNCRTEGTERMAAFCQENGYNLDVMLAKAIGRWEGHEEVLIDGADMQHLIKLHEKYPVLHLDTFPTYDEKEGSCGAVKKILEITKYGDVMPCVFMHISLGNVFDDKLKDIIDRGLSIKYFHDSSPVCLSGVDRNFISKYMSRFYGKPLPVSYTEIFDECDFI
jgi:MoaA/NifB/PqqE/SkfB family radical SAM enzyme